VNDAKNFAQFRLVVAWLALCRGQRLFGLVDIRGDPFQKTVGKRSNGGLGIFDRVGNLVGSGF